MLRMQADAADQVAEALGLTAQAVVARARALVAAR